MEKKRYLITGAGGTIGSALVDKLIKNKNIIVCAFDNDEERLFNISQKYTNSNKINLFLGDIRDKDRLSIAMERIDTVFHCAALKHVSLNEYNQTVIKSSDFWFDLSSIAKGYAVQKIHEYLIANNLPNHLIDIGGEVIVNGFNYKDPWSVGIQDPGSISNKAIYIINNKNGAMLSIATSGEYRNFRITQDAIKKTHTINPDNQKSITSDILSVTILDNKSATRADAYATGFNVIGGIDIIEIANANDIALMLVTSKKGEIELLFSDKWYDFTYE